MIGSVKLPFSLKLNLTTKYAQIKKFIQKFAASERGQKSISDKKFTKFPTNIFASFEGMSTYSINFFSKKKMAEL